MKKEKLQEIIVTLIMFLFAVSAAGYFLFPSQMLRVVGIASNDQMNFLARALGAAFVALIPSAWAARKANNNSFYQNIIVGLIIYLFLSSAVDYYAYLNNIVNNIFIPSVILRIALGGALLWIKLRR